MTKQRKILMDVLDRKNWHPTAEEVYGIVRERAPRISLGTVYRNLDLLAKQGIIQKIETAGVQRRYDGNPEPHFHAQCLKCRKVWDAEVQPDVFNEPLPRLNALPGFTITGYRLVFDGYCLSCRQRSDAPAE